MAGPGDEGTGDGVPPEAPATGGAKGPERKTVRSWRWRRLFVRVRRRVRQGFFGTLLLLVVIVALVAQTGRGQDMALRAALDRVRSSLAGELTVEGVRSGTLLTGATLTGVRLVAEDGRPFVAADSLVIRYSLWSLIRGGSPIRSTVLWGVDLEISQYREDQEMNLQGLVAEGEPEPDTVVAERTPRGALRLGHIGIREGRARVLTPASPTTRTRIVSGPDGERLRELAFENLDLDVEDVIIAPGAEVEFEARLASFTSDIAILDDPLVVREVYGFASFGDAGLRVDDAAFRLPETLMEGDLVFGPTGPDGGWSLGVDLDSGGWGSLEDLAWIDPRIPPGRFRGSAALTVGDGIDIDMQDLEVELEASNVRFDGSVRFDEVMDLRGVTVEASPLSLDRLEPWIGSELPLDGWLSGRATFRGTLDDLGTVGDVTLVPTGYGGEPLRAEFTGTIHRGANPGADDLQLRLDPLNYTVLEAFWPNLPWEGEGSGTVRLDGRAGNGLQIFADLLHHTGDGDRPSSQIGVEGEIRRGGASVGWISDLEIDLRPLSLELFETIAPELGLLGTATGRVHLDGSFSDLHVDGDLETEGGDVGFDARFDAGDPAAAYRVEATVASFRPAAVSTKVPDGTMWTGVVSLEGSGFTADSAAVTGSLSVRDSRVGLVRVDSIDAQLTVRDGVLATDSLRANVAGVGISARGSLGLVEGRSGMSQVEFEAPSIIGLRPIFMGVGDSVMVRDALSELDREFLRAQGIEPDTLPTEEDVRLDGAVVGSASLSGYVEDLELALIVEVTDGRYQDNAVDSARVAFAATSLPALTGAWQIGASADGIVIGSRTFQQGGFEADMFDMSGDGRLEVQRDAGEQYRAVASFALDSVGGFIDMTEASVEVDEQRWILMRPASVSWTEERVSVDSVEVEREGPDPMHLVVDGDIERRGESDFRVVIEGLHAEQVVEVAQLSEMDVEGHVEAELSMRGSAVAPIIDATFRVDGPRYNAMELTELTGSVQYRDRLASFEIEAKDGLRTVLRGFGDLPVDLALVGVEGRMVDAPMDVSIDADSLDAAIALSFVPALEDVEGSVTGRVTVQGTTEAPEPTGSLILTNAAWSLAEIGVRHTEVSGALQLRADRTVDVTLQSRGTGVADITGTVLLEPVSDPEFDLDFTFDRFLAVSRADMEGLVSGGFKLSGSYMRPVVEGSVTVSEGTIFVDELQRSVGVVDLSDPFLFDVGLAVDTTALSAQPLIAGFENPFFDNLRVDVDLAVPRGSWLRSIETNAELSGDLLVRYDRFAGDFVLIGELQAVRGSHLVLGRSFQLVGGTVSFIGRPGLNPDLDIQASTRIRSPDNPPIDVNAQVGGTLVRPVVTLTSDQVGLAEEDLISYMLFGRPSGQLAQGAGQQSLIRSTLYQGLSAAANQLGTALAQEIPELGLDYLAIQQIGGSAETFDPSSARIEAGRYFGDDIFLIVVFSAGANEENPVPGIRVEWALTDDYNVEGFFEDRFLRSGSALLTTTSGLIENDKIWGVFLFREWGYSPGRDR